MWRACWQESSTSAAFLCPIVASLASLTGSTRIILSTVTSPFGLLKNRCIGEYAISVLLILWSRHFDLYRLAYCVLRIDTYISVLVDHPPLVCRGEICVALPKSEDLWNATSEGERRSLQWIEPSGREKVNFYILVREYYDKNGLNDGIRHSFPLTEADNHLTLCTFQARTWQAVLEAHSSDLDDLYTGPIGNNVAQPDRLNLDLWLARAEQGCQLRQNYFTPAVPPPHSNSVFPALSLILWHLLLLNLKAPLKLLQGYGCRFTRRPDPAETDRRNARRRRAWLASTDARFAVRHAAQIARVVAGESTRTPCSTYIQRNPLVLPGLVRSGVVICSYAHATRACPACTGGPPIDLVDVYESADDSDALQKWMERSEGLATWGPYGLPLCGCRAADVAVWFRRALAIDEGYEKEFAAFLEGMSK